MKFKNICCVTGSRAEFGIFKPLLTKLQASKKFNLSLVVTGSHFSHEHGYSVREVRGMFEVDYEIDKFNQNDSQIAKIKEMSEIQDDFSNYLKKTQPDLVIVIGDRYEILPIVIASYMSSIPIAHIHGGEITLGSLDDGIRHAVTQLSQIHFTSTKDYAERVIKMGAKPINVRNVGALGVERVKNHIFMKREKVEKKLGLIFGEVNAVCTLHPPTKEELNISLLLDNLFSVIELHELNVIFTGSNGDAGGVQINESLEKYCRSNPKCKFFPSLGESFFIDVLNQVDFLIGNSSSAFLEAPVLKLPAINIGTRQSGRVAPKNIINSDISVESLSYSIKQSVGLKKKNSLLNLNNPYGNGTSSDQIINFLSNIE